MYLLYVLYVLCIGSTCCTNSITLPADAAGVAYPLGVGNHTDSDAAARIGGSWSGRGVSSAVDPQLDGQNTAPVSLSSASSTIGLVSGNIFL